MPKLSETGSPSPGGGDVDELGYHVVDNQAAAGWSLSECLSTFVGLFVSTKFHFDETISLSGLVSLFFVVVDVPHLWKLCDGITFVILELHF